MNLLQHNPYRLLGVYSNSPTKERLANHNRMKAFLKVGKPVSFPLDLTQYIGSIERTETSVADAEAALTLPKDQIQYAQFWFVKVTPLDDVAFKNLISGKISKAEEIWQKKESASSLQNRIVSALIREDYDCAITCAETLYANSQYISELISAVVGTGSNLNASTLALSFLDALCEEIGVNKLLPFITIDTWKSHIVVKATKPLIDSIEYAIETAQKTKNKGPKARLQAGEKLMTDTKSALSQLKSLLSSTDLQYQIIADKLGLEILQCGIDYYNDSEEPDAAIKAMKLQKYALDIVVGQMAKDRCKENVDILQNIIDNLPPSEVYEEDKAIRQCFKQFACQPHLIKYSIQLLKECAPFLVSIKEKLGNKHRYYLHISSEIVNTALSYLIDEVNAAQEEGFPKLKNVLIEAWRAQLYMDKFDLELNFRTGRYKENRDALYNIISDCKGFESSINRFKYKYGCGWCQNLIVDDIDLRTDDEVYSSCDSISTYKYYLKSFPRGKHISEVKNKISRQERALAPCSTTSEVIAVYENRKSEIFDVDNCSMRAFELAKDKKDFNSILSTFGNSTSGGKKASVEMERREQVRKDLSKRWSKILFWVVIPLVILFGVYLFWGVHGLALTCALLGILSGIVAVILFFAFSNDPDDTDDVGKGCLMLLGAIVLTLIFYFCYEKLEQYVDKTELYEEIVNHPLISDCGYYIRKYPNSDDADNVRDTWLNLILKEAQRFDYDSLAEVTPDSLTNSYDREQSPITDLQEFISDNTGTPYTRKAQSAINSICDSLYRIADEKSTATGWKQYQKKVPKEYYKDSEKKIEYIKKYGWSTEAKAWKMALAENNIPAFEKYRELYPKGAHASLCEKKLINLKVDQMFDGKHGTLPNMTQTGYGGGYSSYITVTNSTEYTLTLLYSGPDTKRLVIPAGGTSSIRLSNGHYRIAAYSSGTGVGSFTGTETLDGGEYCAEYYIQTSFHTSYRTVYK